MARQTAERTEFHVSSEDKATVVHWEGTANGSTACLILDDPDTLVYVKPLLDRYRHGVELVDETGEVLAASWSAVRW